MSLIYAYKGKGITKDFTILDANEAAITPGTNDKIRVTIGRSNETAKFTVTSGTNTEAGSSFTKGAANRLRLDASDLDFERGTYSLWIDYYDAEDASEWKCVDRQVFILEDSSSILDTSEV